MNAVETTNEFELRVGKATAAIAAAVEKARPTCDSRIIQIGMAWNAMRGAAGYGYDEPDDEGKWRRVPIDLAERRAAFLVTIGAESDLRQALADSYPAFAELVEAQVRNAMTPPVDRVLIRMRASREEAGRLLALVKAGREWLLSPEASPHGLAGRLADCRMAAAWCRQRPEAVPGRHRPVIEKLAAQLEQEGNELHDALLTMSWSELEALAAKLK